MAERREDGYYWVSFPNHAPEILKWPGGSWWNGPNHGPADKDCIVIALAKLALAA